MVIAANLGFPRIGPERELKAALERYWGRQTTDHDLLDTARAVRRAGWRVQVAAGLDHIPCNDFSLYDHVLDAAILVGAVPARYRDLRGSPLERYFAMARGTGNLTALRMVKWFDTNYHCLVPELEPDQEFSLDPDKPLDELREAAQAGVAARPVLLGPLSFLLLARDPSGGPAPLRLIDGLVPVYERLLERLAAAGARWVELDEPCLALDLPAPVRAAYPPAYERLARAAPSIRILLATYFGGLGENLPLALRLPVHTLHLDLVRAPAQLDPALAGAPATLSLSLGVVDGRNVWRTDLDRALDTLERAADRLGPERVQVAPSCSLLHCPADLDLEETLDPVLRDGLAFGRQKLEEVAVLARALRRGRGAVAAALAEARRALMAMATSPRRHHPAVTARAAAVSGAMLRRALPREERARRQAGGRPRLPTTTIGSFPQTAEVRAARQKARAGVFTERQYEQFIEGEIAHAIRVQEEAGLDVLVHGEFERSDMVEYFAAELGGFALTHHGWVQSYGSRCVRPPILHGDVVRPRPITVRWARFAQSLTARPVKGMLTGPLTMLQWSFVREDQPRWLTARQLALAVRDEVADLEEAGLGVIQIDEPAIREGLPLRAEHRAEYLSWAVEAFRLASVGARPATQIHTHMCYSDFDDIGGVIAALDADVLLVEGARSALRILDVLERHRYPGDVGVGIWDVHSPRIPTREDIEARLRRALDTIPVERLWVTPDCGLKTRGWREVERALVAMVEAARRLRAERDEPTPILGRKQR